MNAKERLENDGWTPKACRERMAGCRIGIAEAKARGGSGLYSYRLLFVAEYLRNKRRLFTLEHS